MKYKHLTVTTLLLALFTFGFALDADAKRRGGRGGGGGGDRDRVREQVELESVPPVVQATIQQHVGDGKLRAIEKETRRGEVTYEAEVKQKDGMIKGIEVSATGKLISIEVAAPEDAD